MFWLALLNLIVSGTVAWVLLSRIHGAARRCRENLGGAAMSADLAPLARVLVETFDESLLPSAGSPDPNQLPLVYREHQDSYQSLGEALVWIRTNASSDNTATLREVVKAICLVGYTLGLPLDRLQQCLQPFVPRLQQILSQPLNVRTQLASPGQPIDTALMLPLNYGSRVEYPLGFIFLDASGRVLNKAKVLCAG